MSEKIRSVNRLRKGAPPDDVEPSKNTPILQRKGSLDRVLEKGMISLVRVSPKAPMNGTYNFITFYVWITVI